ncbi:MAG: hypothetical protein WC415_00765 [Patescibacteria group bacterium]|jgi:Tfp pilus assembly protein PilO
MQDNVIIEDLKRHKLIKRKINKFFSDYFNWLVLIVVLIILASGYFVILKPRYDQAMTIINIFSQQEALDFENKKNELEKIKELLASYGEVDSKYKEKISSIAPVRKNKEEIFSEINRLISRNGLLFQEISLSTGGSNIFSTADDPNLETVTINFSVLGADYEAFKNFLSAMENNLPLLDILNLSFSPSSRTASFVVNTYYLKE